MSDINEVRERLALELSCTRGTSRVQCLPNDLRALLADHARLQAAHADSLKAMRQAVIALAHAQQEDSVYLISYEILSAAIDAAKAVQP